MKYRQIVSWAWEIAWNNKSLWVFGFLSGLTLGGGSDGPIQFGLTARAGGGAVSLSNDVLWQGGSWLFQNVGTILSSPSTLSILILVLSLLLWFVGVMARSGLVYQVNAIASRERAGKGIGDQFQAAFKVFAPVLWMQLLIWSPVMVLSVIPIAAQETLSCIMVLLIIPLTFIDALAYRSIILENLNVIDGLRRAVQVLTKNIGPILVLSIICTLLALLFSLIAGIVLLPLLLALVKPVLESVSECSRLMGNSQAMLDCIQQSSTDLSVVIPSLVFSIVVAALYSVWVTFQSATFTLAYRHMTDRAAPKSTGDETEPDGINVD